MNPTVSPSRIDNDTTDANARNVEITSRIDSIESRAVQDSSQVAELSQASASMADDILVNNEEMKSNLAAIQGHDESIATIQGLITGAVDEERVDEKIANLQTSFDDTISGYLRVSDVDAAIQSFNVGGLATSSLQLDNGSDNAKLEYDSADKSVTLMTGVGAAPMKLGPGGIQMNGGTIKVNSSSKQLEYCSEGASSCKPLALEENVG